MNTLQVTFDCPVCFEKIFPPVWQCHNGHLVCDDCNKRITICPLCRERWSHRRPIRNLQVERVIKLQFHSCPFGGGKCTEVMSFDQLEDHKLDCGFSELNVCSALNLCCEERRTRLKLTDHLQNDHGIEKISVNNIFRSDYTFNFKFAHRKKTMKIMKTLVIPKLKGQTFPIFFILIGELERNKLTWIPYFIGSKTKAKGFRFEITVTSSNEDVGWLSRGHAVSLWSAQDNFNTPTAQGSLSQPIAEIKTKKERYDVTVTICQHRISSTKNQKA